MVIECIGVGYMLLIFPKHQNVKEEVDVVDSQLASLGYVMRPCVGRREGSVLLIK